MENFISENFFSILAAALIFLVLVFVIVKIHEWLIRITLAALVVTISAVLYNQLAENENWRQQLKKYWNGLIQEDSLEKLIQSEKIKKFQEKLPNQEDIKKNLRSKKDMDKIEEFIEKKNLYNPQKLQKKANSLLEF